MLSSRLSQSSGIVNAAFLIEVKEANADVWNCLRRVRDLAAMPESVDREALAHEFVQGADELLVQLAKEFQLEETLGFIAPSSGATQPGDQTDLGKSSQQHREIYLCLQEMCERAEESEYRGTICRDLNQFREDFGKVDQLLREHERYEAELIRGHLGADAL